MKSAHDEIKKLKGFGLNPDDGPAADRLLIDAFCVHRQAIPLVFVNVPHDAVSNATHIAAVFRGRAGNSSHAAHDGALVTVDDEDGPRPTGFDRQERSVCWRKLSCAARLSELQGDCMTDDLGTRKQGQNSLNRTIYREAIARVRNVRCGNV